MTLLLYYQKYPGLPKIMIIIMDKALHHTDDVDRLYVSRKEGRRGLVSIQDRIDASIQRLEDYMKPRKRNGKKNNFWGILNDKQAIPHTRALDVAKKGNIKRETESLLIAAKNNAIRINNIKARIDKTQQNSKGICSNHSLL